MLAPPIAQLAVLAGGEWKAGVEAADLAEATARHSQVV